MFVCMTQILHKTSMSEIVFFFHWTKKSYKSIETRKCSDVSGYYVRAKEIMPYLKALEF